MVPINQLKYSVFEKVHRIFLTIKEGNYKGGFLHSIWYYWSVLITECFSTNRELEVYNTCTIIKGIIAGNLHTVHCFVKPPANKGQIRSQNCGHRGNTRGGLSHLGEQAVKSSGKHSRCIFHPLSFATLIWPSLPGICPCRAFLGCIFLTPKLWGSQKHFTKVASWGHWKSGDDRHRWISRILWCCCRI